MNSTFKRNLQIGFGLSLFLLVVSSVASYFSIQNLLASSKEVNHTHTVIQELDQVLSIIKDAETGQRGYLLTGDDDFLATYLGSEEKAKQSLLSVKTLTSDNLVQQKKCDQLQVYVLRRFDILKKSINKKKTNIIVTTQDLLEGNSHMIKTRLLISNMKSIEEDLLSKRVAIMNKFSGYTPFLIVFAALLSIIITILFYLRVTSVFSEKTNLMLGLQTKDQDTQNKINIIKSLAEQIALGDYTLRINPVEKDDLGYLALSLDKMAASLEQSFKLLTDKEWMQTGLAKLNETLVSEKDVRDLSTSIIEFIATYTNAQVGAFYLVDDAKNLNFQSGYSFSNVANRKVIKRGEGILGQCALSGKQIVLNEIDADSITISYASGEIKPNSILVEPIFHNHKIKGVMELATTGSFTENDLGFISAATHTIGIAINTSEIRKVQQELLEETQAQSEELQTQHSELETLNVELGLQTQKIQASEEELRVQQEELLQSNQELEERSGLLEEKNQLILERNHDIQDKAKQLELSTKYKSEFLANMSHELRTPLNSILLLSRLMTENVKLDKEQIEYAEVIQTAGRSLLTLIDEILDLSQIESGKMDLDFAEVPVAKIASSMKALFGPVYWEKKLDLQIIVEPGTPSSIETDKLRLEQILKNLLSNALKFTSAGYVQLKISQSQTDRSSIVFSVKDSGMGIPPDKQDLIFEAFKQADGSTRRKFGGTGLGLSISKELARLLGGEIKLISIPGEGSEFIVTLSLVKPSTVLQSAPILVANKFIQPQPEIIYPTQKTERYISETIPQDIEDDRNTVQPDDKTILIIEDDTAFAKALLQYSRQQGYKGIVVVRGDQALAIAIQYNPRAILLDIQLPVKDGWEIMEELKSNSQTRHIPVHIMSSMQVKKRSLQKGAVDFIDKPVALAQMNVMFEKLEEVLSRHPKKVLIVEENPKHAKALNYFLANFNIHSEISENVPHVINLLHQKEVDCVILDMGTDDQKAYETLEEVKKSPGLENLPIIIFTGKSLSKTEEGRIKRYADSIVIKTAHSYKRILDEVGLFLHVVQENAAGEDSVKKNTKTGALSEILQNKTVLIADDDVRNIFSMTKALELHNMNVISAIDGVEALKKLEQNPQVNIILMDMMMPELDGYDTIVRIKNNPQHKNLPILAITAKAMKGDREKCIQAGASDYISKPVDIDQLTSLLRVWLYDK